MKKSLSALTFLLLLINSLWGQVKADDITGVWMTAGNEPAKIQVYRSGEQYFGKIVWLKYPTDGNKPKLDTKNPDKSKRSRPIVGMVILLGFRFDGRNEWGNGRIYDPESGKTYSCYLSLQGKNNLKVRGYIGITLLGRTEVWTRSGV